MIRYFYTRDGVLKQSNTRHSSEANGKLIWVDLLNPEVSELSRIDTEFDLCLPTQEEMKEIEISNRLYEENGATYMTITYISNALGEAPETTQLTFVLQDEVLVTMRYKEMRIINHFIEKIETKRFNELKTGRDLLVFILENFIDLCADVLEKNHTEIEDLSHNTFTQVAKKQDYKQSLKTMAKIGDLNSKIRESLVSLHRLNTFYAGMLESSKMHKETQSKMKALIADTSSLLDHAAFISGKITFALDATLGLVNIEQNAIIKIFSVAAVIFLPPTLVASIYGMNFKHMPELESMLGYPYALVLMFFSALLPWMYFKFKGWL